MESLLQKIRKNWETHQLSVFKTKPKYKNSLKKPVTLILCVSGGCDSVSLLHLLQRLSSLLLLKLHVLHFNHQLRPESGHEQAFVKSLAEQYKIPFHFKTAKHLKPGQAGLQETAREWRIEESIEMLKNIGADCIATGHHADDQTETLMLKWLRGTHISNLQGMLWKKPPFIRPLLNCRKKELMQYLKSNNFSWMEDSTNLSPAYLRNRVRLELIPLLNELTREGLDSRIGDLNEQSSLFREWLDREYAEWRIAARSSESKYDYKISLDDLDKANRLLQEEIIYKFITTKTNMELSYKNLRNIFELLLSENKHWEYSLSEEWKLVNSGNELSLKNEPKI